MSNLLKNFVGIDISKLTFDAALVQEERPDVIVHQQFKQSASGFSQFRAWLQEHKAEMTEETLFCMEYTGIYNTALLDLLCKKKALIWVEMAIKIKQSGGFERGSDDKNDAIKIARYAFRFRDRMSLWSPVDERLSQIKHLIGQRDRIVDSLSRLSNPVEELISIGAITQARMMEKLQSTAIRSLQRAKEKIEKTILEIIRKDKDLSEKAARIQTIKGIGEVTSVAFLVYTNGFKSCESGKQLACYCGVVPFIRKKSGTSVTSKPRVSAFANKKLKKLLHLCALSAISYDNELKNYYARKVAEGKNKMSIINAVRNKLVLRMFALVRDNRDFVNKPLLNCA